MDMKILNPDRHDKSTPALLKRLQGGSTSAIMCTTSTILGLNVFRLEGTISKIIGSTTVILTIIIAGWSSRNMKNIISELQKRHENDSNQRLEPIATTPVDSVDINSAQAHP